MAGDRAKLEEHMQKLLDSIETDLDGKDWKVENFCTAVEVVVIEGDEVSVSLRKRQAGRPAGLLGLLRFAEQDVLGDLLRASVNQAAEKQESKADDT